MTKQVEQTEEKQVRMNKKMHQIQDGNFTSWAPKIPEKAGAQGQT